MTRLRLYVTGHTISADRARAALRDLERRLTAQGEKVIAEVIDVLENPESAGHDQVFATPTLIRMTPAPQLRLFGDLSTSEKLIQGLKLDRTPTRLAETA